MSKVLDNFNVSEIFQRIEGWVRAAEKNIEQIPHRIAQLIRPHFPRSASLIEKIEIDAPLTTTFIFICLVVQLLSIVLGREFVLQYFAVPTIWDFRFLSPYSYVRIVSQTMGHSSWSHLGGNVTHLLLVGPACEYEFGAYNMIRIICWTALASSITHMLLGPTNSVQLGASGVVFMLILLNSLIEAKIGRIPLTFIIQVFFWCYKEIVLQLLRNDGVSHVAHLTGALVGTIAGYYLHEEKIHDKVRIIGKKWLKKAS